MQKATSTPFTSLLAALFVALGLLASPALAQHEVTGEVPDDYRLNHPIAIEERLVTMDIPVGLSTGRLSEATRAKLYRDNAVRLLGLTL